MISMLLPACVILITLFLMIQAIGLALLFLKREEGIAPKEWPSVSIWVAARNEEKNLTECLQSLAALDYPEDKIEILMGNDHSEDTTPEIMERFVHSDIRFRRIDIGENLGKARKKANVLAWLYRESRGEIFLVCDADIQVHPLWAKTLVKPLIRVPGISGGSTLVKPGNLFAELQNLDWAYFLSLISSAARLKIPATVIGNNMAISRQAYEETGGYEYLDFSITEDFKLFAATVKLGYPFFNLTDRPACSLTSAMPDIPSLLKQRKRWMSGGIELPLFWKALLMTYALYWPALLMIAWSLPQMAMSLALFKFFLQSLLVWGMTSKADRKIHFFHLLLYEFYIPFLLIISSVHFIMPGGKDWKGRKF